jgi:imidazolonepropionase
MTLVVTGIGELVTNRSGVPGDLGIVRDAALVVEEGTVAWAGPAGELTPRDADVLDVEGRAVIPGFVDAHTHVVFAGDRSGEFARRLRGEPYEEILAAGGGIHSTVARTRDASLESLVAEGAARVLRMLAAGTTTVEIKSGYGLRAEHEVKMLQAAALVGERTGVTVVRTFLGAHVVDDGVPRDEYVARVIDEMLPACAPIADGCDVFCDRGAFTVDEARRILTAAKGLDLDLRLHAEQLSHSGAAGLAAELGAASADHLDHVTEEGAVAMAAAGVAAVLLPAASFSMGHDQAPARMLWDAGVTVALATDCNPGTSYVESMQLVIALACLQMALTPAEALWAATSGGAAALRLADRGRLSPGAAADLVVLDAPSHQHIPYRPGGNLAWRVMKDGAWVTSGK